MYPHAACMREQNFIVLHVLLQFILKILHVFDSVINLFVYKYRIILYSSALLYTEIIKLCKLKYTPTITTKKKRL